MTFQGKVKIRTHKNVYNFWQNEGKKRNGIFATLRDHYFRYVEIKTILKRIKKTKCKTFRHRMWERCVYIFFSPFAKITAIDYSESLIKSAKNFQKGKNFKNLLKQCDYKDLKAGYKNINFIHGNILNLSKYKNNFNAAICSRVLINLGTPKDQTMAMKNVYDSLKKILCLL